MRSRTSSPSLRPTVCPSTTWPANDLKRRPAPDAPQGVLAMAAPIQEADLSYFLRRHGSNPPFLVAVDGVTDPGNLGAIVRSCDGSGGRLRHRASPSRRARHTDGGQVVGRRCRAHADRCRVGPAERAAADSRCRHLVIGLDDAADRSLFDIDDLATDAVCMVLGAEGAGLSRLVRERCDMIVSIPMGGRLSSLNVSAAAALATYEISRHR